MKKRYFEINNRIISPMNKNNLTGYLNVDTFHFIFDEEWNELDKTLVITVGEDAYNVAILDDEALIPNEAYTGSSVISIGVFGTKVIDEVPQKILATPPFKLQIQKGVYEEGEEPSNLPTPTQWDLYVTEINRLLNLCNADVETCQDILEDIESIKTDVLQAKGLAETAATNAQTSATNAQNSAESAENSAESAAEDAAQAGVHEENIERMIDEFNPQLENKVDKEEGKGLSTNDYDNTEKQKVEANTTARHTHSNKSVIDGISGNDVSNWNNKVDKNVNNLVNYELKTNTGASLSVSIDAQTYVMTIALKNSAGTVLSSHEVDLPLETMVVGASYDSVNKKIILTLQNGQSIEVSIADLISGLVPNSRKIAGVDLNDDITKSELLNALNVEDGAEVNVIETIKVDGVTVSVTDKTVNIDLSGKADKVNGGTAGNFVSLDANGNIQDSGKKASDFLTQHQDISGKEDKTNKVTSINSNSTDTQYPSAKCVYTEFTGVKNDIATLQNKSRHIYGIKRKITGNSSSAWERTDDAVGLVANAIKNGSAVVNDFDNLSPWKDIITFNLDLTTKKIKAYYGEADFKFDGSNGDVYTHIPDIYIKIWQENDYDYIQIADYAKTGFTKINAFDIQRYHTGLVDNTLRSYSGLYPARNKTLPAFRTSAQALGSEFCLMDWRYFVLQLLYLVEYADYNSQSKLGNGMTSMRFSTDDKALIAEENTNRIVINTTGGNAFVIGQTIAIGTARESFNVTSAERTITAIADYSEEGITGKSITFDGAPVNIAINNVIWSCGQAAGGCDSLGMKSGCLANDSKHAVIYRGVENIFGNIWQWVDSLNMKDGQVYACYNPANYQSDKFNDGYDAIGYMNATTEGYAKELGYDPNNPLIKLTKTVGGGSTTYITDYYYVNATGNRVALVGGVLGSGLGAGLWFWGFDRGSSHAYWSFGARVLKYQ